MPASFPTKAQTSAFLKNLSALVELAEGHGSAAEAAQRVILAAEKLGVLDVVYHKIALDVFRHAHRFQGTLGRAAETFKPKAQAGPQFPEIPARCVFTDPPDDETTVLVGGEDDNLAFAYCLSDEWFCAITDDPLSFEPVSWSYNPEFV